jgi:hypothetical protein
MPVGSRDAIQPFGRVYAVIDMRNYNIIYVGSTKDTLHIRYQNHCRTGKSKKATPFGKHIVSEGLEHFKMQLIGEFENVSRAFIETKEREFINVIGTKGLFNKYKPIVLKPERRKYNTEWKAEKYARDPDYYVKIATACGKRYGEKHGCIVCGTKPVSVTHVNNHNKTANHKKRMDDSNMITEAYQKLFV